MFGTFVILNCRFFGHYEMMCGCMVRKDRRKEWEELREGGKEMEEWKEGNVEGWNEGKRE